MNILNGLCKILFEVGSPPGGRGKIYSVVPPLVLDSKSPSNFDVEGIPRLEVGSK